MSETMEEAVIDPIPGIIAKLKCPRCGGDREHIILLQACSHLEAIEFRVDEMAPTEECKHDSDGWELHCEWQDCLRTTGSRPITALEAGLTQDEWEDLRDAADDNEYD